MRLRLTRDQIAKIVGNDPEAIKQFERLFSSVNEISNSTLSEVEALAGLALSLAQSALEIAQRDTIQPSPVEYVPQDFIEVRPEPREKISLLHDVYLDTPLSGEALLFNGDKWVNGLLTGGLSGQTTINLTAASLEWIETVTATGVVPSDKIGVFIAPHSDGDENSEEFLDVLALTGTAGTDQITVTASFLSQTSGQIKLFWKVL